MRFTYCQLREILYRKKQKRFASWLLDFGVEDSELLFAYIQQQNIPEFLFLQTLNNFHNINA